MADAETTETVRKIKDLGPLHALLLKATPPDGNGKVSITVLADRLEISTESIYKWIRDNRIPPGRAAEVVDQAEGRVTLGDFSVFVYL